MENTQLLILARLSDQDLKTKLRRIDTAYHITKDNDVRKQMLLLMDDIKTLLIKRGTYDKPI